MPGSGYQLILVGVFDNVDEALSLERKISRVDLPVRGEAKLVGGNVMHHVWIGPVSDLVALEAKMLMMNLSKLDARAATFDETASVKRASRLDARPQKVDVKAKSTSSKQYPENFNLARLPEKRPLPPKAP